MYQVQMIKADNASIFIDMDKLPETGVQGVARMKAWKKYGCEVIPETEYVAFPEYDDSDLRTGVWHWQQIDHDM